MLICVTGGRSEEGGTRVFPSESPLDTAAAFATLLAKIRSGDLASAAELEAVFLPGLCTLLRFRVPPSEIEEKARKILHEVLARIFMDTPTVTHDQLLSMICDTMHRFAPETKAAPPSWRTDPKSTERTLKALMRTTPEERKILERYYLEARTISEIAAELKLRESYVRERISRLREELCSPAGEDPDQFK
jgi:hypothetical protein